MDPLHVRLRPTKLSEVIGQDAVVASLRSVLKKDPPHSFLFLGPSGCGKTTLARILARDIGIEEASVTELDAASYSGIDVMREITSTMKYKAFGSNPRKMIIVDECHALSKQTWQSLLISIEEPPEHAYWALCTTEASKVPRTIVTRCHSYTVRSVPAMQLYDYAIDVADAEKLKATEDAIMVAARSAAGSVRQLLVNLSAVRDCKTKQEAQGALSLIEEQDSFIPLVKMLTRGKFTWSEAVQTLKPLMEDDPEGLRISVTNYVAKVLSGTNDAGRAQKLLAVLEAFSRPCNSSDKMAPILLAIGSLIL